MRSVVFAALSALLLVTAGCKSQCRLLNEKQCECATDSTSRNNCFARASSLETANPPNADQEATCETLIEGCDCRLLDTPAGKERCGIAVAGPADAGN